VTTATNSGLRCFFGVSAVLAVIALTQQSWGFLLLEGTWALVSAYALFFGRRRRTPAAP